MSDKSISDMVQRVAHAMAKVDMLDVLASGAVAKYGSPEDLAAAALEASVELAAGYHRHARAALEAMGLDPDAQPEAPRPRGKWGEPMAPLVPRSVEKP